MFVTAGAALAAEDETRFKPKVYAGKTSQERAYLAKTYPSSEANGYVGKTVQKPSSGFWSLFTSNRQQPAEKRAEAAPAGGPRYVQREWISVPTISADPSAVPEKKPFDDNGKRVAETPYQAQDKPTAKNPLLKPRQDLKVHE